MIDQPINHLIVEQIVAILWNMHNQQINIRQLIIPGSGVKTILIVSLLYFSRHFTNSPKKATPHKPIPIRIHIPMSTSTHRQARHKRQFSQNHTIHNDIQIHLNPSRISTQSVQVPVHTKHKSPYRDQLISRGKI